MNLSEAKEHVETSQTELQGHEKLRTIRELRTPEETQRDNQAAEITIHITLVLILAATVAALIWTGPVWVYWWFAQPVAIFELYWPNLLLPFVELAWLVGTALAIMLLLTSIGSTVSLLKRIFRL